MNEPTVTNVRVGYRKWPWKLEAEYGARLNPDLSKILSRELKHFGIFYDGSLVAAVTRERLAQLHEAIGEALEATAEFAPEDPTPTPPNAGSSAFEEQA